MPAPLSLEHLRRHALARSLFTPTTLRRAIHRLGFVQADPLRAPARAQDLTLRHRVAGYRAGDLERHYARLGIEEDFFINYGFMPRLTQALMHPRTPRTAWPPERLAQAQAVLDFVRQRGVVHPAEVDAAFAHGSSTNWFGGTGRASTELLDGLHYRGLLRVPRREAGVRLYAVRQQAAAVPGPAPAATRVPTALPEATTAYDALADVVLQLYAPLPERTLAELVSRIRHGAPQWTPLVRATVARTKARLPNAVVDGLRWYWPAGENPGSRRHQIDDAVRLLAPFDPLVWCRRRFELFWGWAYRFEAYTPAHKRLRGHYALPLLWQGQVIGWGNLAWQEGRLQADIGFVDGMRPARSGNGFGAALDDELQRMQDFLQTA